MGRKTGKRTKGNAKPSSSSQAAEFLENSSKPQFVGFQTLGAEYGLPDDPDLEIPSDLRVALKKLCKKDSVTKTKALQELLELINSRLGDELKTVLAFWARVYIKLTNDEDWRVRERTNVVHGVLLCKVRGLFAPYLRPVIGPWLVSQCDPYTPVAIAAKSAFCLVFSYWKQGQALLKHDKAIVEYLGQGIKELSVTVNAKSSSAGAASVEEQLQPETQLSSLLGAFVLFLDLVERQDELVQLTEAILNNADFWKLGKHTNDMLRLSFYQTLAVTCTRHPAMITTQEEQFCIAVFHNVDERSVAVAKVVWECVLPLAKNVPTWHSSKNRLRKIVLPKMWRMFEAGLGGRAHVIGPNILPFYSVWTDEDSRAFLKDFFISLSGGIQLIGLTPGKAAENRSILTSSHKELHALVQVFIDCMQYTIIKKMPKYPDTKEIMTFLIDRVWLKLMEMTFDKPLGIPLSPVLYQHTFDALEVLNTGYSEMFEKRLQDIAFDRFWKSFENILHALVFLNKDSVSAARKMMVFFTRLFQGPSKKPNLCKNTGRVVRFPRDIDFSTYHIPAIGEVTIDDSPDITDDESDNDPMQYVQYEFLSKSDIAEFLGRIASWLWRCYKTGKSHQLYLSVFAMVVRHTPDFVLNSIEGLLFPNEDPKHYDCEPAYILLKVLVKIKGRLDENILEDLVAVVVSRGHQLEEITRLRLISIMVDKPHLRPVTFRHIVEQWPTMTPCLLQCPTITPYISCMCKDLIQTNTHNLQLWKTFERFLHICAAFKWKEVSQSIMPAIQLVIESLADNTMTTTIYTKDLSNLEHHILVAKLFFEHCVGLVPFPLLDDLSCYVFRLFLTVSLLPLNTGQDTVKSLIRTAWYTCREQVLQSCKELDDTSVMQMARTCAAMAQISVASETISVNCLRKVAKILLEASTPLQDHLSMDIQIRGHFETILIPSEEFVVGYDYLSGAQVPPIHVRSIIARKHLPDGLPGLLYNCILQEEKYCLLTDNALQSMLATLFYFQTLCGQALTLYPVEWRAMRECLAEIKKFSGIFLDEYRSTREQCVPKACQCTVHCVERFLLEKAVAQGGYWNGALRKFLIEMVKYSYTEGYPYDKEGLLLEMWPAIGEEGNQEVAVLPPNTTYCTWRQWSGDKKNKYSLEKCPELLAYFMEHADVLKPSNATNLNDQEKGELCEKFSQFCVTITRKSHSNLVRAQILQSMRQFNSRFRLPVEVVIALVTLFEEWQCPILKEDGKIVLADAWGSVLLTCQELLLFKDCFEANGLELSSSAWSYFSVLLLASMERLVQYAGDILVRDLQPIILLHAVIPVFSSLCSIVAYENIATCQCGNHKFRFIDVVKGWDRMASLCFKKLLTILMYLGVPSIENKRGCSDLLLELCLKEVCNALMYAPADYLIESIRNGYPLSFPDDILRPLREMPYQITNMDDDYEDSSVFSLAPQFKAQLHLNEIRATLKEITPLIMVANASVQCTVLMLLKKWLPELNNLEHVAAAMNSAPEGQERLVPPTPVWQMILYCETKLEPAIPSNLELGQVWVIENQALNATAMAYLLLWDLLLELLEKVTPRVRACYISFAVYHHSLDCLLNYLTFWLPTKPYNSSYFATSQEFVQSLFLPISKEKWEKEDLHRRAILVYAKLLTTFGAPIRHWWQKQPRPAMEFLGGYTAQYFSPLLCEQQIATVSNAVLEEGFSVKGFPIANEVVASYSKEDLRMEICVKLPANYPLGPVQVDTKRRVGFNEKQWRTWEMQMCTLLTNQNGSLREAIEIWQRQVKQIMEGLEECCICYSLVHGTNFQLPKLRCKQCHKLFHSFCLFKWFESGQTSSCPLCREQW